MIPPRLQDWQRVRGVFENALAQPAERRLTFVTEACGSDEDLRRQVIALLDSHDRAAGFLETPAVVSLGEVSANLHLEGTHFGPYRLEALIGSGGMGEVYRARDTRLQRTVAIKVLSAHLSTTQTARERFEREARAVAAFNHPNICTLYDIGSYHPHSPREGDEAIHYLVMELVEGETLWDRLARGPLPIRDALDIASQIASALRRAHEVGIIHRDLKPKNIMLTPSGPKLLDFGLAKATSVTAATATTPVSDLTTPGMILGTLHYMAPEQIEAGVTDARTDLFALGTVLYEMVTGRKAFDARSSAGLLSAILALEPVPVKNHIPSISDEVEDLIERCLAKDPERRWQTAADLEHALQRAAQFSPSRLRALSHRARAAARGWWIAGATVLTLLMVIVGGLWIARSPRTSSASATASTPSTQVAVLPLRVMGDPGNSDAYLGVGIADAIITRLATVRQIGLRPTAAVLSYADTPAEPMTAARALSVDHVLVGTIQPSANTYRVTLQLVRSPESTVTWARSYDVVRGGLLGLQDAVAEQVVDALRLELTSAERERLGRRYTENVEAYDLYVRGRALLVNYTESSMTSAIEAFERALAIDPQYALARAGLAVACAWFSIRYAYETDAMTWGERAEREARTALASDPSLAEATLAIASAAGTLYGGFNWSAVIDEATRAVALDPTLDLAHLVRMRAFFHLGLFDRMADEANASRRINPLGNVEIARLEVAASLFSGGYDRARAQALSLLARSDAPVIRNYLGLAQFYTGNTVEGRETLSGVQRGGRPDIRSQAALAGVEAATGDHESARERALVIERGPYMDHHVAYSLAAVWAQLGDTAATVKWLQRAVDTGFPCYPWVARDPLLDPIRSQPQFSAFVQQLKVSHDRDTSRYLRGA
ncbi:MAG: protein kinase [Vicinamibacterales bacterium]